MIKESLILLGFVLALSYLFNRVIKKMTHTPRRSDEYEHPGTKEKENVPESIAPPPPVQLAARVDKDLDSLNKADPRSVATLISDWVDTDK